MKEKITEAFAGEEKKHVEIYYLMLTVLLRKLTGE